MSCTLINQTRTAPTSTFNLMLKTKIVIMIGERLFNIPLNDPRIDYVTDPISKKFHITFLNDVEQANDSNLAIAKGSSIYAGR